MVSESEFALSESQNASNPGSSRDREPAPALPDLSELRTKFRAVAEGYREGIYEAIIGIYEIRQAAERDTDLQSQLLERCAEHSKQTPKPAKLTLELTKFVVGQSSKRERQRCSKIATAIDYLRRLEMTETECLDHLRSFGIEQLAQLARKTSSQFTASELAAEPQRLVARPAPLIPLKALGEAVSDLVDKRCHLAGWVRMTKTNQYNLEVADIFGEDEIAAGANDENSSEARIALGFPRLSTTDLQKFYFSPRRLK
jgi:hypothetical protein